MPRPRAPTRELFQCTNRRRSGGKCVLYRCKRCGREMLENTYRFAIHITVCKKASEKDRTTAIGQLLKTKKYGSNNTVAHVSDDAADLMKKPALPAAHQQQHYDDRRRHQQQQQSSSLPAWPSAATTTPTDDAMASEHHLMMTRAAEVPKIKNETNLHLMLSLPAARRAHHFQEKEQVIPPPSSNIKSVYDDDGGGKMTAPPLECLVDQQHRQLLLTANRPNCTARGSHKMRQHLLPHHPASVPTTADAGARLEATRNTAGASTKIGTIDFDSSHHTPSMFSLDTLLMADDHHAADPDEQHQSAITAAALVGMGSDDAFLCDNYQSAAYWGGGAQDRLLSPRYFYDECSHQLIYPPPPPAYSYQPAAWASYMMMMRPPLFDC